LQIELALGLECSESTPKTNNGKGTNLNRDAVVGVREQSMKIFVLVVATVWEP